MNKIKLLLRLMKQLNIRAWKIAVPVIFSLLASVSEGVFTLLMVPLINGMVNRNFAGLLDNPAMGKFAGLFSSFSLDNRSALIILAAFLVISLVAKNAFFFLSQVSVSGTLRKAISRARDYLFGEFLVLGKAFFDKNNAGQLQNILVNYLNAIGTQLVFFQNAITTILMLMVYLAIMIKMSWVLSLVVVTIFPLLYYSYLWLVKKMRDSSTKYAETQKLLNKKIFNILSAVPLIKAYSYEEKEKSEFAKITDKIQEIEYGLDKKRSFLGPSQDIIINGVILLLVCVIYIVSANYQFAKIGEYVVFLYILKRVSAYFGFFTSVKAVIAYFSGMLNEILALLDSRSIYRIPEGSINFSDFQKKISFNGLSFSYNNGTKVLDSINFEIEKGKTTAIVGPSGAGKSTLINLLLRFYDCGKGMIKIDGTDIREYSFSSLRKKISLVSQDTFLFNETLKYNLLYGLTRNVSIEELNDAIRKARIDELVSKMLDKYETQLGDRGIMLSGGEKQRVAIARAILRDPEILILDEATSSLDTHNEIMVQGALYELMQGKTVIAIAHRLSTIKNADKIIVIEQGRIIEQGSLDTLLAKKGAFYGYWEEQKFY